MGPSKAGIIALTTVMCAVCVLVGVPMLAAWQAQTASCATTPTDTGADTSVPLSAGAAGAPLTVRMATWNVLKSNSNQRIVTGLTTIATAGADVIAVQELQSSHRGTAARRLRAAGWEMSDGNTATPVLWRASRYRLLAQGRVKEFGVVRIEPGSAAGTSIGPKWIQWVQLQDTTTGAVFIAASHHLVPGIESKGRTDRHGPRRVAYAKKQILAAGQLAQQLSRHGQIPFLIGSDWNIDARKDARVRTLGFPYATLSAYGLYSNWRVLGYPKQGTHGDRLIDGIFSTTKTIAPVRQQILGHYGSDHRAALVQYTNRSRSAATLTTDTAAQAGSLPAKITVPSSTSGGKMILTGEQVSNAAVIIAEGRKANIPSFGWVVAIAAALQESGLRNLDHGDRDSQGLFQQRPSTGWGTISQIRHPHLAAQAFYGVATHTTNRGLVDVTGWQSMSVAEAAQAVQISAFPTAYAKWEAAARAVVQQLSDGQTASTTPALCGAGTDQQLGECPATGSPAEQGLTRDALLVLRCAKSEFPTLIDFGGVHPDPLPDHPSGRAVDIMIPNYQTAEGKVFGWQIAHWLQSNREALGVQYVIFDAKIWSVERDGEGWRTYRPGYTNSINDSSLHLNHVHVTVDGDAGTGLHTNRDSTSTAAAGKWVMALPRGSYTVGCGFACYVSTAGLPHTGQDFPTPVGTTVRSTNIGTVEVSKDLTGSYGSYIVIRDAVDPTITVYYAHLSARDVTVGQHVTAGQIIGRSGSTGHSSGPHLHYEIRLNGNPVNPLPILAKNGVTP